MAKPHFLENAALARVTAFEAALSEAKHRLAADATAGAMQALERAHVLGQTHFGPHLKAHRGMVHVGFTPRNWRDVRGQIMRIALVPVGYLPTHRDVCAGAVAGHRLWPSRPA